MEADNICLCVCVPIQADVSTTNVENHSARAHDRAHVCLQLFMQCEYKDKRKRAALSPSYRLFVAFLFAPSIG